MADAWMTAALDQGEAQMVDSLLTMAAEHDGEETHVAAAALLMELLAEPGMNRLALATGVATLALRLHRAAGGHRPACPIDAGCPVDHLKREGRP